MTTDADKAAARYVLSDEVDFDGQSADVRAVLDSWCASCPTPDSPDDSQLELETRAREVLDDE